MEHISLQDFIHKHWTLSDIPNYPSGMDVVNSIRDKEKGLYTFFPSWAIRRLDSAFARSNTVHPDTGNALYTICRASNANHVFETGTYWGYSTAYLAAALEDANATGKVHTFDIYPHAGKYIPKTLRSRVALYRGKPSTEMMPEVLKQIAPDLFFQDSRHDYEGVSEELKVVTPYLKPGSVVLFHDFVEPNVRRAAIDCLRDYTIYILESQDPQQLGLAVRNYE